MVMASMHNTGLARAGRDLLRLADLAFIEHRRASLAVHADLVRAMRALTNALGAARQVDQVQLAVGNVVGAQPVLGEAAIFLQARRHDVTDLQRRAKQRPRIGEEFLVARAVIVVVGGGVDAQNAVHVEAARSRRRRDGTRSTRTAGAAAS